MSREKGDAMELRRGRSAAATALLLVTGAITAVGASTGTGEGGGTAAEGAPVTPPADHHMHVWSAAARDALVEMIAQGREGPPPELPTFDGEDVVARLDSAGIEQGVLLSTAYVFGTPDLDVADERRKVREENDWVARQAGAHPERLVAFFGVNPLADYAGDAIGHCAETEACGGMKLQLANSDVDFHDPGDVDRLQAFFSDLQERGLPVVVHLQTRRDGFGAEEVDVFVDEVLTAAPDVTVQIAHMGGNSRFDSATVRSFDALARAVEAHPDRMDDVVFDMGLVPFPPQRARGDTARQRIYRRWNRRFAEAVRRLGPDRVLFGTDYPEARPGPYATRLRESLPLNDREIDDLYDDRAPYLR